MCKNLESIFKVLNEIKVSAHTTAKDQSLTENNMKRAIKFYQGCYDKYEFLSCNHCVSNELTDLRIAIHTLKKRLYN